MEDKLITIATETFARAQILKARLESEGIKCVLSNLNLVQSTVSSGVRVKVAEKDLKKAVKIFVKVKGDYLRNGERRMPRKRNIRKIIVPVDFSENAMHTAQFSLNIGHIYKAHVKFVHVYHVPAIDMVTAPDVNFSQFSLETIAQELKQKAEKQMKEFLQNIKIFAASHNLFDAKIKSSVIEGIPDDMILLEAKKYNANFIIIGSKSDKNKPDSFLGSVAWSIIQKSKVPVISVPDNFNWKPESKDYNIMYATDLDDGVFKASRKLLALLRPINNVKLHCVHVTNKAPNVYQKTKMKELKDYLTTVAKYKLSLDFVESKDYISAFNNYVNDKKIDLICMSTRKRNIIERFFSPSLAKKMLYHSYAPLLIIHL